MLLSRWGWWKWELTSPGKCCAPTWTPGGSAASGCDPGWTGIHPGASPLGPHGLGRCSAPQSCLFVTPWTTAHQASLSFTISRSLLRLRSTESVMPSNHLILCRPLLHGLGGQGKGHLGGHLGVSSQTATPDFLEPTSEKETCLGFRVTSSSFWDWGSPWRCVQGACAHGGGAGRCVYVRYGPVGGACLCTSSPLPELCLQRK